MQLVYIHDGRPVALNDRVKLDDGEYTVGHFAKPHKPSSGGKVIVYLGGNPRAAREFYVSVIGAHWINREDQR